MAFKVLLVYMVSFVLTKVSIFLLGQRIQLSDAVFLFLFLVWLKGTIKNRKLPRDTGLNKPFLLFIGFCLLSFFNSTDLVLSAAELLGLIYLFVMLILVVDIVDDRRKLDIIIKSWVGILAVVLAFGFIGWCIGILTGEKNTFCWFYHGKFPYVNRPICRALSTFHNPLALANYLLVSSGFVASELLLAENKRYKAFLKVVIFFTCLIMTATLSREILCFMVFFFLIYSHFHKIKDMKFKAIRFASISFIIIIFLLSTVAGSIFHIRSFKLGNFSCAYRERFVFKIAALEMVKRHPFLGVGLKMYRSYLQKLNNENFFYLKGVVPIYSYHKEGQYFDYPSINDPHNDMLQYVAETGIFGGAACILFIAAFLYLMFASLKKKIADDRYFKTRLFCFFAAFVGILIESMDLDVFKVRHVWFLMALTLALIAMHKDKINNEED